MQNRLSVNSSKVNIDSLSYNTLKSMLGNLIESRGALVKLARELDGTMEIVRDGQQVEIAKLLHNSLPFELLSKRKAQKSTLVEILVKCWAVISGIMEH
jgi:hypothetical protein